MEKILMISCRLELINSKEEALYLAEQLRDIVKGMLPITYSAAAFNAAFTPTVKNSYYDAPPSVSDKSTQDIPVSTNSDSALPEIVKSVPNLVASVTNLVATTPSFKPIISVSPINIKSTSLFSKSPKPKNDEEFTFYKVPYNEKRWDENNLYTNLSKLAFTKTFNDGSKKKVVSCTSVPRWIWPLDRSGNMYEKIQHLVEDFDYECVRDDPKKPNMYIIISDV